MNQRQRLQRYDRQIVHFRLCLPRCLTRGIGERKTSVGHAQDRRANCQPQNAVPQQHPGEGNQLRVALKRSPVLREVRDRIAPKRIHHGRQLADRQVSRELACSEVTDQQHHAPRIDGKHFPSHRRQREEDRGGQNQVGKDQGEIRLKIGESILRPHARGIQPRHEGADPRSQSHAGEDGQLHRERAQKSAREIVKLGDRSRVEKCRGIAVHVLVGRLPGQRCGHDHAKETDVHDDHVQRERRRDQHLVSGAKVDGRFSKRPARHEHEQESQPQKHQEIHVG
jgi:hypothetical protein